MSTQPFFLSALLASFLFVTGTAHAAGTSVGVSAAVGQSDSYAYSLFLRQTYEPWLSGNVGELTPNIEIGGHAWTHDDTDTVWGAYAAPGVTFTLFTNSALQPYLGGSLGGVINSEDHIGSRDLGSHALFRTKGVVGVQFGESLNHRLQGEYINYSNWGIANTNDGYSTYGVSYGYSF